MPKYTEANSNSAVRKRVPLREAYIEAYPEKTPILTMCPKTTGKRPTSDGGSEVHWFFKTFEEGEYGSVYDGDDFTSDEAVNNDANKTVLKGRVQLTRSGVWTGRIAEATIQQHGNVTSKHLDDKKDMLRKLRESKEKIISSAQHSKAQAASPKVAFQTRGFVAWGESADHADLPIDAMAKMPAAQRKVVADVGDFAENDLRAMMQSCFETREAEGNWHAFIHPDMQTHMDNWLILGDVTSTKVPIRRFNQDVAKKEIDLMVRSFKGSFGKAHFTPKNRLPEQFTYSVTTTNTSATVTVDTNKKFTAGMQIKGTGIPSGARILSVPKTTNGGPGTTLVLSAACTASATVTATVDQTVLAEFWDMNFVELAYIDEVGWVPLENQGGGQRGYSDCLYTFANLNPQAHALILKTF
jgi:hypothetical protein